ATALTVASRRSIAARVAASAAVTLLIVVLVLGVALSAVLVNTVQDSAAERLERRLDTEVEAAAVAAPAPRRGDARLVACSLASGQLPVLQRLADSPRASNELLEELQTLSRFLVPDASLAYVARSGTVQGAAKLDAATVIGLAGSPVVTEAIRSGDPRGSVDVVAGRALAIGVHPAQLNGQNCEAGPVLGVVVVVSPLDATYLARAANDDGDLSLALVGRTAVLASHGSQPPAAGIAAMVRRAVDDGRRSSAVVGGRFVAVAPVRAADDTPKLAMVASTPTTLVNRTRDELFQNLFLIALGGTLLALLLAALVGARIGAGLRRLRTAAEAIQRGDLGVRADVASEDEVGVLGRTFDAMASSVQEKTAAEVRLRGRLEAVVAGMGEALVAVDGGGRVTEFNHAAEQLLGVGRAQAQGRPVDEVVRLAGDDGSSINDALHTNSAGRWSTLGWVERSDGSRVPVAVSVGTLRGPSAETGGNVLVLADLTREREVEQMKTEFLSRVGHELRTPLTKVIGFADLLHRKRVPEEQARDWNQEILTQSKSLLRIVKMLEFFAASGAGRVYLRPEEFDPRAVVDDVVRRWGQQSGRPDDIRPRVRRATPKVVADRRLLVSCLDELVDNAVKFSPDGGRIVVAAEPAEGGGVELSVSDHGIGMTRAEQERAFSEFVQGDPSDTRRYGGLGLGLAFVQRVVEAHGGRLSCRSEPEKGSRFSIVLPAVPKENGR
ncbi:MAG: ATP-binding protein, partial [Actinomycetota bacterium]|nr:ATP-binding protein [Actinomycetota bacterium]